MQGSQGGGSMFLAKNLEKELFDFRRPAHGLRAERRCLIAHGPREIRGQFDLMVVGNHKGLQQQ